MGSELGLIADALHSLEFQPRRPGELLDGAAGTLDGFLFAQFFGI